MLHLAANRNAGPNVIPTRVLWNGQNISIAQQFVFGGVTGRYGRKLNRYIFAVRVLRITRSVPGKMGIDRISRALQPSGHLDQIFDVHVGRQRITARLGHFTFHIHRSGIYLRGVALHKKTIARLQQ